MTNLKTILMSSVAAMSLAAAPTFAQETMQTEAAGTEQTAQTSGGRSFDETYGDQFAGLGDRNVQELIGTPVTNDAGETIGEVDNFGVSSDDQIVAIVGIGGFLGMGEHSVALPIDSLSFDGEQLLISGVTREELEAMPQYDEGESQTFAADQTFRGAYEGTGMPGTGTAPTDTAGMQPSDDPAADQPMDDAQQEVATAAETEADAETTVEEQMAETGTAESGLEQAGEEVAQTAGQAGDAAQNAGEEMAQTAGQAGEAVQDTGEQAAEGVAQATDEATDEAGQMTETAGTEVQEGEAAETEVVTTEEAQPMAEETETAATGEAQPTGDQAQTAATDDAGWTQEMDSIFADIADRQIAELIGMDVAGANGEVVGEVDNFALAGEDVVAVVGVGGFLGIGEHQVALSLSDMTYDGERLVLSSMTEEQLREMPEYQENEANSLPQEGTLRSTYDQ